MVLATILFIVCGFAAGVLCTLCRLSGRFSASERLDEARRMRADLEAQERRNTTPRTK